MHHIHHAGMEIGSWAEWATAAIALLAFAGAIVSLFYTAQAASQSANANRITAAAYERDTKDRNEAQARLVYSTVSASVFFANNRFASTSGIKRSIAAAGTVEHETYAVVAQRDIVVARITVINNSAEIIGPVHVSLYDDRDGTSIDGGLGIEDDDPLLPSTEVQYELITTDASRAQNLAPMIRFRDSSGNWWTRRNYEPIEASDA